MTITRLVAILMLGWLASGSTVLAEDLQDISWEDLAPAVEPYDDPFLELPEDQLYDLSNVYFYEGSQNAEEAEAAAESRRRLEAAGLDIAYYMAQRDIVVEKRMEAASRINTEVLDKLVRLAGYLLPLEMNERLVVEFLLVPYVGACIHTPPPDANQVIHVVYPQGFPAEGLFDPVWITGRMIGQSSTKSVGYSDGTSEVVVGYKMDAVMVEHYVY